MSGISLKEISDITGLCYSGENRIVSHLCYADSGVENGLSFCVSRAYLKKMIRAGLVKSVFCPGSLHESLTEEEKENLSVVITDDPAGDFYYLHNYLYEKTGFYSEYDFEPVIGAGCDIHPTAFIERGVVVHDGAVIGPHVSIMKGSVIGKSVQIKANTVIGAEGNATNFKVKGRPSAIHHAGGVVIGDHSVVGSLCVISRNVLNGILKIGRECQIDNGVHIGHNSDIGDRCTLSAGSVVCGGVVMENECYLAPGTIVRDKIRLKQGTRTHLGTVLVSDTEDHAVMAGFYAMPHTSWLMKIKNDRQAYAIKK